LQREIRSHEEQFSRSDEKERSLLDELQRLDDKIDQQRKKIEELAGRIGEQEAVIAAKGQELRELEEKHEVRRQHLIKRMRAFYLMGKTGFFNVAFSSRTLPDLVVANEAFLNLVTFDRSVFAAFRENMAEIRRVAQARELEKSVLEKFREDAEREQQDLRTTAEEKSTLLKRVQTEKGLFAQALKEMKKAEGELTSALTRLNKAGKAQGLARSRGLLPPPVEGQLVGRFNQTPADEEDAIFANGITINTPTGTEVRAVFAGEVIFAGYMRGYGKMIIIDHDQQYYTVTARFDDLRVREGDQVSQGQVIGTAGEMATLFGKGLYFEIRHGTVAEDPLAWLRPRSFTGS
jgi:septal ring factor EnvC (AmiA/AmiB activator)